MFDVSKLTLDEVGEEIDKTIDNLQRLQALYAAMQTQDLRRIEKLVKEFNAIKKKERRCPRCNGHFDNSRMGSCNCPSPAVDESSRGPQPF